MQLLASDSREAETTRAGPRGERRWKGASEEVEAGERSKSRKGCEERAEVEADGAVECWETK
jgi:hypothetical protein